MKKNSPTEILPDVDQVLQGEGQTCPLEGPAAAAQGHQWTWSARCQTLPTLSTPRFVKEEFVHDVTLNCCVLARIKTKVAFFQGASSITWLFQIKVNSASPSS